MIEEKMADCKEKEFILIVRLSDELAKKLNNSCNGESYGIECRCDCDFQELGRNSEIHRKIKSRLFYAMKVKPNVSGEIFMKDHRTQEFIAKATFIVPVEREYEIVELKNI